MTMLVLLGITIVLGITKASIVNDAEIRREADAVVEEICQAYGEASNTCTAANAELDSVLKQPLKIAVVGMSGSGKSTTTNTLAGYSDSAAMAKDEKGRSVGALVCNAGRACTGEVEGGEFRSEGYRVDGTENIRIYDLPGCGTEKTPLWARDRGKLSRRGCDVTIDCKTHADKLQETCKKSADVAMCLLRGQAGTSKTVEACDYWERFDLQCGYDVYVLVMNQMRRNFEYECDHYLIKKVLDTRKFHYVLFNQINSYIENFFDAEEDEEIHTLNATEIERRMDSFMFSAGCPSNGTGVIRPDGEQDIKPLLKGQRMTDSKIKGLTRDRVFGVDARWKSRKKYEMQRFKNTLIKDIAMRIKEKLMRRVAMADQSADAQAEYTIWIASGAAAAISGLLVAPMADVVPNMLVSAAMVTILANVYGIKWAALAVDAGAGVPLQAAPGAALQIAIAFAASRLGENGLAQGAQLFNFAIPGVGQAAKGAISAYTMRSTGQMAKRLMTSTAADRAEMLAGVRALAPEWVERLPIIDCIVRKLSAAVMAKITAMDAATAIFYECWREAPEGPGDEKFEL